MSEAKLSLAHTAIGKTKPDLGRSKIVGSRCGIAKFHNNSFFPIGENLALSYVAAHPVDARKSFDGLVALVESEFGLEVMSGHLFVFLNRRAPVAQMLFWDRNGFCIVKKRLESGTFA
jgi:hypothetical protein